MNRRALRVSGVAVALAVLAAGCSAEVGPTPLPLWTQPTPGPNTICMLAKVGGTLITDPVTGLGLTDKAGHASHVYWPSGYTARPDGDRVALIAPDGHTVARTGDVIGMGGGYGSDDAVTVCPSTTIEVLATAPPST